MLGDSRSDSKIMAIQSRSFPTTYRLVLKNYWSWIQLIILSAFFSASWNAISHALYQACICARLPNNNNKRHVWIFWNIRTFMSQSLRNLKLCRNLGFAMISLTRTKTWWGFQWFTKKQIQASIKKTADLFSLVAKQKKITLGTVAHWTLKLFNGNTKTKSVQSQIIESYHSKEKKSGKSLIVAQILRRMHSRNGITDNETDNVETSFPWLT